MLTFPVGLMNQSSQDDPYLANVVLHLKGDGANNSTNIVDSSPTPKTITRYGDTKISTAQSKYGGSSIYFDGNGDYLTASTTNGLGTVFTLEFWMYLESTNGFLFNSRGNGGFGADGIDIMVTLNTSTQGRSIFGAATVNTSVWTHIAFVRNSSNTMKRFINGVLNASSNISNVFSAGTLSIGGSAGGNIGYMQGYFDSFRLTYAERYTANFNPETDTFLAY